MKRGIFLTLLFGFFAFGFSNAQEMKKVVEITKFSDYQCPACKYYGAILDQAKEEYGNQIKVTYKNYPLRIHQYAELAARAAMAAKQQEKFMEMHEMLFTGQEQWSKGNAEAIFIGYAQSLKLNMEQFNKDLNSARMNRLVLADKREGGALGVNSTPTFYINGRKIERLPRTYEGFKVLIDAQLK